MTNKIKPFYIHIEGLSNEQIGEAIDKCVEVGANPREGVKDYHTYKDFLDLCVPQIYKRFGVNYNNNTIFYNGAEYYGEHAIEITLEQLDGHLGITPNQEVCNQVNEFKVGDEVVVGFVTPMIRWVTYVSNDGKFIVVKDENGSEAGCQASDAKHNKPDPFAEYVSRVEKAYRKLSLDNAHSVLTQDQKDLIGICWDLKDEYIES